MPPLAARARVAEADATVVVGRAGIAELAARDAHLGVGVAELRPAHVVAFAGYVGREHGHARGRRLEPVTVGALGALVLRARHADAGLLEADGAGRDAVVTELRRRTIERVVARAVVARLAGLAVVVVIFVVLGADDDPVARVPRTLAVIVVVVVERAAEHAALRGREPRDAGVEAALVHLGHGLHETIVVHVVDLEVVEPARGQEAEDVHTLAPIAVGHRVGRVGAACVQVAQGAEHLAVAAAGHAYATGRVGVAGRVASRPIAGVIATAREHEHDSREPGDDACHGSP